MIGGSGNTSMRLPKLIVVSGSSGSGKTTLAHEIARAVGCPAICRDEIKEGMVHAHPGFTPGPGDPLTRRTFTTFFDVLHLLLRARVTVVAEAAFKGSVWQPHLERLSEFAELRVVQCTVDAAIAHARRTQRDAGSSIRQAAHEAPTGKPPTSFESISLAVPSICVDTTEKYHPAMEDIISFIHG
jgi:predicted kinase